LIDPYLAPKHSRPSFTGASLNPTADLPVSSEAILDGVELVVVSHLHSDHFDPLAQTLVPQPLPLICQPGDEQTIRDKGFTAVKPLTDSITWQGITITRTGGHHGLGSVEAAMGHVMGIVLQAAGEPTVYWAGDTVLCAEVSAALDAFAPAVIVTHSCGAQWPDAEGERQLIVMDAAQTLEVCRAMPGSTVLATHMEALDHATVSRTDLRAAAQRAGIPDSRLLIPADGEIIELG
jgi:L-ascorbate metabolism protein UlaG (beta-lactamase superfamily)